MSKELDKLHTAMVRNGIDPYTGNALPRYNRVAVQKAIDRDKRIGKKEARLIHAVLKGRQKKDE